MYEMPARAVRRQLTVASVPAALAGVLVAGVPLGFALVSVQAAAVALVVALVMLLAVHVMAHAAVRALAGRLREVTDPEHLRAA